MHSNTNDDKPVCQRKKISANLCEALKFRLKNRKEECRVFKEVKLCSMSSGFLKKNDKLKYKLLVRFTLLQYSSAVKVLDSCLGQMFRTNLCITQNSVTNETFEKLTVEFNSVS